MQIFITFANLKNVTLNLEQSKNKDNRPKLSDLKEQRYEVAIAPTYVSLGITWLVFLSLHRDLGLLKFFKKIKTYKVAIANDYIHHGESVHTHSTFQFFVFPFHFATTFYLFFFANIRFAYLFCKYL